MHLHLHLRERALHSRCLIISDDAAVSNIIEESIVEFEIIMNFSSFTAQNHTLARGAGNLACNESIAFNIVLMQREYSSFGIIWIHLPIEFQTGTTLGGTTRGTFRGGSSWSWRQFD